MFIDHAMHHCTVCYELCFKIGTYVPTLTAILNLARNMHTIGTHLQCSTIKYNSNDPDVLRFSVAIVRLCIYMIMYAYTFLVISYTFASRNSEHICNNEDINVHYYSRPRFFNETSYVGSI